MKRLFTITNAIETRVEEILRSKITYWKKKDSSLVSNIDIEIQASIIEIIINLYPCDNIICEEGKQVSGDNKSLYSWVIDPIDGTDNFIHGKKEFGISIGLMRENKFIEALLIFPELAEKYYAAKGDGVWKNNKVFVPDEHNDGWNKEVILCSKTHKALKPVFESKGYTVNFYRCATYSLLMLLKRKALLYHTVNTMIYDVGPMSFIIEEAGIASFDKEKKNLAFSKNTLSIPFFLSMSGDTIPDDVYTILISDSL